MQERSLSGCQVSGVGCQVSGVRGQGNPATLRLATFDYKSLKIVVLLGLVLLVGCQTATSEPESATTTLAPPTPGQTAQDYYDEGWGTHYYQGDYDQALAAFSRAVELDPDFAPAYYSRGWMYALTGDQARAIADYNRAVALLRQAIERDPDDSGAHNDLAWTLAYYLDQDYEAALSHARRSVELKPQAYNQDTLAFVYFKLGRYEKALEHYNLALSLDSEQFDSCIGRGDTYAALGQPEAALADYKTCLTLDLPQASRAALEAKVKSLQNGQGD